MNKVKFVQDFLKALEIGASLDEFYHPEVIQIEYPNTLTRSLTQRNFEELKEASEKGKSVLEQQRYEVLKSYETEDAVIIEAIWHGTLAVPIGNLKPGDEMRAYFAQFYEFKDARIIKQRNYDCFEPF